MAHGVKTFFVPNLELPAEVLDSHQGIINLAFSGNPELVLLFSKFQRNLVQNLGKFIEDLQGDMAVGS
jgi:hypothetical protein